MITTEKFAILLVLAVLFVLAVYTDGADHNSLRKLMRRRKVLPPPTRLEGMSNLIKMRRRKKVMFPSNDDMAVDSPLEPLKKFNANDSLSNTVDVPVERLPLKKLVKRRKKNKLQSIILKPDIESRHPLKKTPPPPDVLAKNRTSFHKRCEFV